MLFWWARSISSLAAKNCGKLFFLLLLSTSEMVEGNKVKLLQ